MKIFNLVAEMIMSSNPDTEHRIFCDGSLSSTVEYSLEFVKALFKLHFESRKDDYIKAIIERLSSRGLISPNIAKIDRSSDEFSTAVFFYRKTLLEMPLEQQQQIATAVICGVKIVVINSTDSNYITTATFIVEFASGHRMKFRVHANGGLFDQNNCPISTERPYLFGLI